MLSHAIEMTRDAVTGPWEQGAHPITTPDFARNDLAYLSGTRKFQTRLGALAGRFRVTDKVGTANGATLALDGTTILTLERPTNAQLHAQLPLLNAYADLRMDRIAEIQVQLDDILSFFGAMSQLDSDRRKHSLQLMVLVQSLCIQLEMQVKHYCHGKRPVDFDLAIQPVIQTPDHSTFPSGHATEAYALATIMHRLQSGKSAKHGVDNNALPFRIAHRIAANRTVAGVHYPVDSAAGAVLGIVIAEAVLSLCDGAKPSTATLDWASLPADPATDPEGPRDFTPASLKAGLTLGQLGSRTTTDPLIEALWTNVQTEW